MGGEGEGRGGEGEGRGERERREGKGCDPRSLMLILGSVSVSTLCELLHYEHF